MTAGSIAESRFRFAAKGKRSGIRTKGLSIGVSPPHIMEGTMASLNSVTPEVSPEQKASNELVWRILKLRWMGMDEEAERLRKEFRDIKPVGSVLAGPPDTD